MANFIVSYDLNGSSPSHSEMDAHLAKLGVARGRILETVWYVGYEGSLSDLYDHVASILSGNDLLFVCEAAEAIWGKLLVDTAGLQKSWEKYRG